MAQSIIVSTKKVLVYNNNVLSNTNVSEACKKERAKTKWNFHQLTEVTFLLLY